jgi:uncharacterized RDD family membrane protein YckC
VLRCLCGRLTWEDVVSCTTAGTRPVGSDLVVPRSNDQPTDTGRPASASQDDSWFDTRPSVSGSGSPATPVGENPAGERDDPGIPSAAPVPLWPPPPPHVMPGPQWAAPETRAQTNGPYDNGSAVPSRRTTRGTAHVDSLGQPLASWPKRFLAILVDFLLLSALLSWFGHAVFPNLLSSSAAIYNSVPQSQALSFLGVSFLVWVGYLSLLGSSRRGQTLGMMLYGIAVRDLEGGPVKLGRAIVRSVILVAASGFLVDAFWPLWDPRRQALHDKPARTVVVDMRLAKLLEQLPPGIR